MSEVQTPSMGFVDAVKSAYTNYANFSGRARRSEYWWFALFNQLAGFLVLLLIGSMIAVSGDGAAAGALGLLWLVITFFAFGLPGLSLTVRRLHDLGYSGATLLLFLLGFFIPIINLIAMIAFIVAMCRRIGVKQVRSRPSICRKCKWGTPAPPNLLHPQVRRLPRRTCFRRVNTTSTSTSTPPPPPPPPPPVPDTGIPYIWV